MKIIVTGAFNCSTEQLEKIEKYGNKCIYVQDEKSDIKGIEKNEIEGIICNAFFMHHDITDFPNLKFIQLTSAGLDRVPIDYIKEKNIKLYNARGVYSIPMAEWTILKILEIYKNSKFFYKNQLNRVWEKNRNISELCGKIATIVGYGNVGGEIARRLNAFDVKINVVDVMKKEDNLINEFFNINDLKSAMEKSDIVILTLPLTKETEGIINYENLSCMKENSVLVNISRGKVINENDLIKACKLNKFRGVALDVFETEPLNENSDLWNYDNILISPHNSFVGENNQSRLYDVVISNLRQFMEDK